MKRRQLIIFPAIILAMLCLLFLVGSNQYLESPILIFAFGSIVATVLLDLRSRKHPLKKHVPYALTLVVLSYAWTWVVVNFWENNFFHVQPTWLFILIIAITVLAFRYFHQKKPKKHHDDFGHPLSKKMLAHYRAAGLSDTEIDVFRKTMARTKLEILELETVMQSVPKLRAINLNHDTLNLAKALFAALVKEPQRLQEVGDFIYKHLPNSLQIAKKYREINQHEMKTNDTYAVLDRSVEMLASLSEQIKADYLDFVQEDVSDLASTLDAINNPRNNPDFSAQNDQSIEQMQAQLNKVQQDYLSKQMNQDKTKDDPLDNQNDKETGDQKDD